MILFTELFFSLHRATLPGDNDEVQNKLIRQSFLEAVETVGSDFTLIDKIINTDNPQEIIDEEIQGTDDTVG